MEIPVYLTELWILSSYSLLVKGSIWGSWGSCPSTWPEPAGWRTFTHSVCSTLIGSMPRWILVMASDRSIQIQILWCEYWPLIGQYRSHDLDKQVYYTLAVRLCPLLSAGWLWGCPHILSRRGQETGELTIMTRSRAPSIMLGIYLLEPEILCLVEISLSRWGWCPRVSDWAAQCWPHTRPCWGLS